MEYELFARGDERRRKAAAAALNPILVSSRDRAKKDRPPAPVAPPSSCDAFHQPARPPPAARRGLRAPLSFLHHPSPAPAPFSPLSGGRRGAVVASICLPRPCAEVLSRRETFGQIRLSQIGFRTGLRGRPPARPPGVSGRRPRRRGRRRRTQGHSFFLLFRKAALLPRPRRWRGGGGLAPSGGCCCSYGGASRTSKSRVFLPRSRSLSLARRPILFSERSCSVASVRLRLSSLIAGAISVRNLLHDHPASLPPDQPVHRPDDKHV